MKHFCPIILVMIYDFIQLKYLQNYSKNWQKVFWAGDNFSLNIID